MKVKIQIETITFVRFWLVLIGFAFALLAIYNARTALVLVLIALFLAIALSLPVNKLAAKMPGNSRVAGTAIAFAAIIALLLAVVFLVVPPIIEQTGHFISTVPGIVSAASERWASLGDLIQKYNLQPQIDEAVNSFGKSLTSWVAAFGSNLIGAVGSLFSAIVSGVLVIVLTFLMLVEGPSWMKALWSVYRNEELRDYHKEVVGRLYRMFTGFINGQLAVSAIGATCSAIVVMILSAIFPDVPFNLAFPILIITFVLALIPMFGATIAGMLSGLLLVLNDPAAAVIYVVYFILYQQVENNFISPKIQAKQLSLSPLAILLSVTIGTYMIGLAGGIISIPIAGAIKILLEEYFDHRDESDDHDEKPTTFKKILTKLRAPKPSKS